jgi:sterol 3beta-glucosyltransferase
LTIRSSLAGSDALCLRLCPLVAQTLADAGKLKMSELEIHRPKEYPTRKQATDPISGGATAVLGVVINSGAGFAQIFTNPPKGLLNTTMAIPRGFFDSVVNMSEGFGSFIKLYGQLLFIYARQSDI